MGAVVADIVSFTNAFFGSVVSPLWSTWTAGTILSIPLLIWLLREIVKSIRKLY